MIHRAIPKHGSGTRPGAILSCPSEQDSPGQHEVGAWGVLQSPIISIHSFTALTHPIVLGRADRVHISALPPVPSRRPAKLVLGSMFTLRTSHPTAGCRPFTRDHCTEEQSPTKLQTKPLGPIQGVSPRTFYIELWAHGYTPTCSHSALYFFSQNSYICIKNEVYV